MREALAKIKPKTEVENMPTEKPTTEGPFMPEVPEAPADTVAAQVLAILAEFDPGAPEARFSKEATMGRVRRMRALLDTGRGGDRMKP